MPNLLFRSEELTSNWVPSGTVVPTITLNAATDPDGSTTADRVQWGSTQSSRVDQTVTNTTRSDVRHTLAVNVRAVLNPTTFRLAAFDNGSGGFQTSIVNASTDWTKVSWVFTYGDGAARSISLRNNATGTSTDVDFWGASLEPELLGRYRKTETSVFLTDKQMLRSGRLRARKRSQF